MHNTNATGDVRDMLTALFATASTLWAEQDFAGARAALTAALQMMDAPAHFRAYAQLRIAQSFRTEGQPDAAKAEYALIAANADYFPHHREEAAEILAEIAREERGLPARDPLASRVQVPPVTVFAAEVWVATDGDDANPGTEAAPCASLAGARDAVRALKAAGCVGAILVRIQSGTYPMHESFALTAEDSGTADAPVVYRAEEKGGAIFYGGVRISGFAPVTDGDILARLPEEARGKVMQCDLRQLGITDYGALHQRGYGARKYASTPAPELYFDRQPQTLARWPNAGFVNTAGLVAPASDTTTMLSTFAYDNDRPTRWATAPDPWLFGYWQASWADGTVAVESIDPATKRITTKTPYRDGTGIELDLAIPYYAFNLLEEIDMPGEWYLDRGTGILYLYPPADPAAATVELSMLSTPMVTMDDVSHVRLEGLTFDLARFDGVVIRGGEGCLLAGCTISRLAGSAINIDGGYGHGVLGCDLFTLGRGGISATGGDRQTLVPGGHFVENCHIYDFSRIDRTYTPAVQVEGVGARIAHNLIHDTPCHAVRLGGNEHLMEFNEVHSVTYESDDQGAVDMFGNPTFRGVVFRYNYFHHVNGDDDRPRAGIRLDDVISGLLIYGNIFYRSAQGHFGAVQINSGRENIVENNIVADSKQGFSGGWTPGWSENNDFWTTFNAGKSPEWTDYITSDLYRTRYPLLTRLFDHPPINFLWRNVVWNSGRTYSMTPHCTDIMELIVYTDDNPGFVDPAHGDFRLRPDAPLFTRLAFRPIPVEEIGLYNDEYRASWPVTSTPREVPDWRTLSG